MGFFFPVLGIDDHVAAVVVGGKEMAGDVACWPSHQIIRFIQDDFIRHCLVHRNA